jgi:hypothetical protein
LDGKNIGTIFSRAALQEQAVSGNERAQHAGRLARPVGAFFWRS